MAVVYELPAIAGIYILIGVLFVVAYTFTLLAHALNVSVFGTHPFGSLARVIENTIVNGCKDGIDALEHYAVRFEGFLVDSLQLLLAILLLPIAGVKAALAYLWDQMVKPAIGSATGNARILANEALATAKAAERTIARDVRRLDAKITAATAAAYQTLTREYHIAIREAGKEIWKGIDELGNTLHRELRDAIHGIEGTTSGVVGTLDAATEATIQAIQDAEQATTDELGTILRGLNPADVAGLLASIPVLTALVQAIATESGLDSAACRAKVRGICGTDPRTWENLLGGLAAMTIAFNLRELIEFGNEMVGILEPEIRAIEAA